MGYLLKEALKTLCGANQWSYAVFWKIGYQNPMLLIWEECYYEATTFWNSPHVFGITGSPEHASVGSRTSFLGVQSGNKVHSLITRMMRDSYVNLLGEGLVGRAAFSGKHMWVLSDEYTREAYPLEVADQIYLQFSAGMQTVAIIPVLHHGVVQFGSSLPIFENLEFLNNVTSLVLQLGCVPGALLLENYERKEDVTKTTPKCRSSICLDKSVSVDSTGRSQVTDSTPFIAESCNQQGCSSRNSGLVGRVSSPLQQSKKIIQTTDINSSYSKYDRQLDFGAAKKGGLRLVEQQALSDGDVRKNHAKGCFNVSPVFMKPQKINELCRSMGSVRTSTSNPHSFSHSYFTENNFATVLVDGSGKIADPSNTEAALSQLRDRLDSNNLLSVRSNTRNCSLSEACMEVGLSARKEQLEDRLFELPNMPLGFTADEINLMGVLRSSFDDSLNCENVNPKHKIVGDKQAFVQEKNRSGDDLFDVVGVDFKNKKHDGNLSSFLDNLPEVNPVNTSNIYFGLQQLSGEGSDLSLIDEGYVENSFFPKLVGDHLLDAVISSAGQSSMQNADDNLSCRMTLTKVSTSSAPVVSSSFGQSIGFNQMQGELLAIPKSLAKVGELQSCFFQSGIYKEDEGDYSENKSAYDPRSRPDDASKQNRRKLKHGENPRPRPKDRQMIQDRLKELREMVPHGAKCSIDALLERTIKHMLFLESVMKHADKLKQTEDSKIIGKDGLLFKDNFSGGATWAYEVGLQSVVCPIVVEDLNEPRQMVVEMLCEERGLFLEIADVIRELGLTILKGVMESRDNKIWARFTVEANRDVTRMEVFVSLVCLVEQTVKSSGAPSNCLQNGNLVVHNSLLQAASVAATDG